MITAGNPHRGCGYCGAPPVETKSRCGTFTWLHSPTDCCPQRLARVKRATDRAASDYPPPKAESRRLYEWPLPESP